MSKNYNGKWLHKNTRRALYIRDRFTCQCCLSTIKDSTLTIDHILAKELGGTNNTKNLIVLCLSCNSAKGAKTTEQWHEYLKRSKGFSDESILELKKRFKNSSRRVLPRKKARQEVKEGLSHKDSFFQKYSTTPRR